MNWNKIRLEVIKRDNNKCVSCNTFVTDNEAKVDHIQPRSLGGEKYNKDNLQTLCRNCNKIKNKQDAKKLAKLRGSGNKEWTAMVNKKLFFKIESLRHNMQCDTRAQFLQKLTEDMPPTGGSATPRKEAD